MHFSIAQKQSRISILLCPNFPNNVSTWLDSASCRCLIRQACSHRYKGNWTADQRQDSFTDKRTAGGVFRVAVATAICLPRAADEPVGSTPGTSAKCVAEQGSRWLAGMPNATRCYMAVVFLVFSSDADLSAFTTSCRLFVTLLLPSSAQLSTRAQERASL